MKKLYVALVLTFFVLPLFAQNIPSYVPKDGLVGWWPFNGNANDESGNGNDGIVSEATLISDRNGNSNSAYDFDGDNDYIDISTTNGNFNNQQYTISLWYKLNSKFSSVYGGHKVNPVIISRVSQQSVIYDNFVVFEINGGINFNSGTSAQVAAGYITKNDTTNNWNNITYSVSNDSCRTYLNGIKVYTQVIDGSLNFLNVPIRVGGSQNIYWKDFQGLIDDIGYWNRSLSPIEVKNLFYTCIHEQAQSNSFNSILLTTSPSLKLSGIPSEGIYTGNAIQQDTFIATAAKIGLNTVKYTYKNSQGCNDSTFFTMIVADTVGNICKKYDTITNNITKYDTMTVTNNVTKYDTVKINKTIFDTVTVTNNVTKYDTVKVTKFDTLTIKNNVYDTVTITNNITKYDTVKVTKYDTLTIKNNIYDTVTITNNITKYDTITLTDTVSILKIKFKLTTGIQANQMASMSVYPNPTTDILHIEVGDAKALDGYRYRILDALGKEVYNELVKNTITEIPLKTLGAAGLYQLEVLDANKTSIQTNKIVLQ